MKYRGFLSYSRSDKEFARRLHAWLEEFRIPSGFGTLSELNADVALGSVFIDTAELPAGPDLGALIEGALDVSASLIVVCSAEAAASPWVEKEILYFRRRKPEAPCVGILAAGQSFRKENVPAALRFRLKDGKLSKKPQEPLIANPAELGENSAFLQIVAGVLGVGRNELADRHAEREERNRRRRRRLAAKVHTLPAREAFVTGDIELALKHALAAVLEGDDPTWSEAPELEATVVEYALALRDRARHRFPTNPGKYAVFDRVELTPDRRFVLGGTRVGKIHVWDAETGHHVTRLERKAPWSHYPKVFQEEDWSARTWHHPMTEMALSPDGSVLALSHGDSRVTLWRTVDWQELGFVNDTAYSGHFLVFRHDSRRIAIARSWSEYALTSEPRTWVIDLETFQFLIIAEPADQHLIALTWPDQTDEICGVSKQGRLLVWSALDGELTHAVDLNEERVHSAEFSPDGAELALGLEGAMPVFWQREAGGGWVRQRQLPQGSDVGEGFDQTLVGLRAAPNWRSFLVWADGRPTLWSWPSMQVVSRLPPVWADHTTFSPDARLLAIETEDQVDLVESETGQTTVTLQTEGERTMLPISTETEKLRRRIYSADGALIALKILPPKAATVDMRDLVADFSGLGTDRQSIKIFDTKTGQLLDHAYPGRNASAIGFSRSGRRFWAQLNQSELRMRSVPSRSGASERQVASLTSDAALGELSFSGDGRWLAAIESTGGIGQQKRLKIWALPAKNHPQFIDLREDIWRLVFSPDSRTLLASSGRGTIRYFQQKKGRWRISEELVEYPSGEEPLLDIMKMSPTGRHVAYGSKEEFYGPAIVRDLADGHIRKFPPSGRPALKDLAFSTNGRLLAMVDEEGEVSVWDLESGEQAMHGDPGIGSGGAAVGFWEPSEESAQVVAADLNGKVRKYDLASGRSLGDIDLNLFNPAYGFDDARISSDGRYLVAAEGAFLHCLEIPSGRWKVLDNHYEKATPPFAFSPDNSFVATGAMDRAVLLWRLENGERVSILHGHDAQIETLAFSAEGNLLASSDIEGGLRIWNIELAFLRGKVLTAWLCDRLSLGLGDIREDLDNMLLRDVLPSDDSGDLVAAIRARWPELSSSPPE